MPINAQLIEKMLLEKGFICCSETKKKKGFHASEINQYVYINKTSGDKFSTLIIHPEFKNKRQQFLMLNGVESSDFLYHASNMKELPKRLNTGLKPISYGIPFGFKTSSACEEFINKLMINE